MNLDKTYSNYYFTNTRTKKEPTKTTGAPPEALTVNNINQL